MDLALPGLQTIVRTAAPANRYGDRHSRRGAALSPSPLDDQWTMASVDWPGAPGQELPLAASQVGLLVLICRSCRLPEGSAFPSR